MGISGFPYQGEPCLQSNTQESTNGSRLPGIEQGHGEEVLPDTKFGLHQEYRGWEPVHLGGRSEGGLQSSGQRAGDEEEDGRIVCRRLLAA